MRTASPFTIQFKQARSNGGILIYNRDESTSFSNRVKKVFIQFPFISIIHQLFVEQACSSGKARGPIFNHPLIYSPNPWKMWKPISCFCPVVSTRKWNYKNDFEDAKACILILVISTLSCKLITKKCKTPFYFSIYFIRYALFL